MRREFAILFSMLMPGTGHVYMGKTVKGLILMILAMVGLFVFLMPHACDNISWSMQEYIVVAIVWIVAWIVGVVDSARCSSHDTSKSE